MFVNTASDAEIEQMVRQYRRGVVNSMLEYLILNCLENGRMCGYDIIKLLHEKFHTLLSPGQVYPVINSMSRHGLIRKQKEGRSVMLESSNLGRSLLMAWRVEFSMIQAQVSNLSVRELKTAS